MMNAVLLIVLSLLNSSVQQDQTAERIVKRAEDLLKGKTSRGVFSMTIVTPDYTRTLEMESWWVGNEKALIVIKSPRREAGNKTLKVENELWMYLRNTETTIKLPPSMMLQSWNGSDFTNDDLVRESNITRDYTMKIVKEEAIKNELCWKIELNPKPEAPVVWGRLFYWVRKADYLPALVEYYDEKGRLARAIEYSEFKILGGRKVPVRWTMYNKIKPGHHTELAITDIAFDIKLSERIFSFQELERGR